VHVQGNAAVTVPMNALVTQRQLARRRRGGAKTAALVTAMTVENVRIKQRRRNARSFIICVEK